MNKLNSSLGQGLFSTSAGSIGEVLCELYSYMVTGLTRSRFDYYAYMLLRSPFYLYDITLIPTITSIIMCGMKLPVHTQTSTVAVWESISNLSHIFEWM